jgi:hypothetical protein
MAGGRSADRPDGIVPELCEELLPPIPGLASCLGQNALTAREPQQADDRVETMCRPTGRCLHLLSHRRNRPPRCSMRRELVVPCFEIPRGPRMSSPRSQERSTRSGQRGETAAWLGGILIALPDLVKGLGRRTAPHREGAVTSLIESAGHPHVLSDFVDIDVAAVRPASCRHDGPTRESDELLVSRCRLGQSGAEGSRRRNHRGRDPIRAARGLARSLASCADWRADRGRAAPSAERTIRPTSPS